MALDAGSVYTLLGGRFSPAAFEQFDAANKKSIAAATAAEARIAAAGASVEKAHQRSASAAERAATVQSAAAAKTGSAAESAAAKTTLWSRNSEQASKNLGTLGTVAAKTAAVGIVAVGAATVYAAAKATGFHREMLKIATQAGGTTSEVKALEKQVLALAGSVPQGPQKLAEGLYHIESAGFRGSQAMDMLTNAAKGAALGNASLENTTQAMIATMASNIKGVNGAADAMGQLNTIVGVGDMRMEQLAQAMATGILPTAHDAGLSLKDVGAALATVTDNATPANVTATRLRMTLALMAAPSKAAQKQLESIGLTSTSLAHDMRQPNGLLLAIEDLKTHLHASGKSAEEQDAILSKVFGGGKSSAVIHTLISETDRLRQKYDQLGQTSGVDKLNKSWADFQKSEAAAFGELKSGAEAFAITVGQVVLPELAKLAHGATHALDGFIKSGGAADLGAGITGAFDAIGHAVSTLAPDAEALALVLYHVGAAAVSVGQTFGLGLSGQIATAAAAFLAFKAAAFVAPMLLATAGAFRALAAAVAEGGLASLPGALLGVLGPVRLIAIAAGLAAGAFVALQSGLFSSASAAEKNAAAFSADDKALKGLADATDKTVKAHFAAERAALAHQRAAEDLKRTEREVHDGTLKGAEAQDRMREAHLRFAETLNDNTNASKDWTKTLGHERAEAQAASGVIRKRQDEIKAEIALTNNQIAAAKQSHASKAELPALLAKLAQQQKAYNDTVRATAVLQADAALHEENRRRQEAGQSAITAANTQGVRNLQLALSQARAPQKIVTRYELDDQGAQAKLGELAAKLSSLGHQQVVAKVLTTAPSAAAALLALRAVIAGVPASKVIRILHNAPNAQSAMNSLTGAIHSVPGNKGVTISTNAGQAKSEIDSVQAAVNGLTGVKTIAINVQKTVTTVENVIKGAVGPKHASGRGPGADETALVGEGQGPEYVIDSSGRGMLVNRPTLMGLGPDEYVIPVEERFRGRALGLFAMLARDLNIPGFKAGRPPGGHPRHPSTSHRHAPRYIPAHLDALSLPVDEIQTSADHAKSVYDKARGAVKALDGRIAGAQHALHFASPKGNARQKAAAALKELQTKRANALAEERKDAQELKYAQRALRDAKAYQGKITRETDLANIAANDMRIADGRDDSAGYSAAKNRRLTSLGLLKALIAAAQRHVKVDSAYFRQLEQQVQTSTIEAQTTEDEAFQPHRTKAQEDEERTGMTPAELAEEKRIERDIALAALTPDLADDKQRAGELVSFLSKVLGEAQAEPAVRGGDETITSIANALKTAQSNLASLSGGTSTNENPDLQAQITQAKEREANEKRRADIAEQSLAVFGGSGDIGAGGPNAARAGAGVVQNIYTLHPGDPSTLSAIGSAAVSGIGLQGSRRAVRERVGP